MLAPSDADDRFEDSPLDDPMSRLAASLAGSPGTGIAFAMLDQLRECLGAEAVALAELDEAGSVTRIVARSAPRGCTVREELHRLPALMAAAGAKLPASNRAAPTSFALNPPGSCIRWLAYMPVTDRLGARAGAVVAAFGNRPTAAALDEGAPLFTVAASVASSEFRLAREIAAREKSETSLREVEPFACLGRLACGISHDFNNLLTVILGHTSLLERNLPPGETGQARESLSVIASAARRSVSLVSQLLDFIRPGSSGREPCDLNDLVEKFAGMVRNLVEESIAIETSLAPKPVSVVADSCKLGRVFMNLITNARDAMPRGGRIRLGVAATELGENSALSPGRYALLTVEDNGAGMPPQIRDRAFEPYFSTKRSGKGSGIGLANVAAIVKEHNGSIEVRSEVGKGTAVRILLPLAGSEAAPRRRTGPVPVAAGDDSIRGASVLLVEDEASVRKLVRKLLELFGCEVTEAESGRHALDLWPSLEEKVSLVITDVVMPGGVSGWDLARELHAKHPGLGILLTSGYNESPKEHGLEDVPQIAFLQKPYESKALRSTLLRLLPGDRKA